VSHDINKSNAGPTSATVSPAKLRILLACGVIAGQLFVGVAALQALTRDGLNSQPSLPQPAEPGDLGWIQVTNFVVPGLLPTAFAVGTWLVLHQGRAGTWGAILRGVFGAGLVAGGVFVPDPSLAYPPGAPGDSRRSTRVSTSLVRGTKAVPLERAKYTKCMILTYASQQDCDGMAGQATDLPAWSPEGFAAMGLFKEAFNRQLVESGELIEARALAAPLHTRRLGVQSSVPFVTDGTPKPRTRWPVTGSWKATASTWRPKLQAGLQPAPHQNMSSPTGTPTYGRSWNPPPKFPSHMRGTDKQR
jgi:hypothetical protein